MSFGRAVKRLSLKDWAAIKEHWLEILNHYPDVGKTPPLTIQECLEFNSQLLAFSNTEKEKEINLPDLKLLAFRESMQLAHKSCACLRSIERDLSVGQCTHAEITAYNGAFLMAKSIMLLLGVGFTNKAIGKQQLIVDVLTLRKRKFVINLISANISTNLMHKEVWLLFKRLINTLSNHPIDDELKPLLHDLDPGEISRIRNRVQYQNAAWLYEDLLHGEKSTISWIKPFDKSLYFNTHAEDLESHFNFHFHLMLVRAFHKLLADLQDFSSAKEEQQILNLNYGACDATMRTMSWLA